MDVTANELPPGIHELTLQDLQRYAFSPTRVALLHSLEAIVAQLISYRLAGQVLIGGSYLLTGKQEPSDIDCAIALRPAPLAALTAQQKGKLLTLLENKSCRDQGVDLYCFNESDFHQYAYWLGLYGFGKYSQEARGVIKVRFDGSQAKGLAGAGSWQTDQAGRSVRKKA